MSSPDQVRSLFEIATGMPREEREALLRLYKHEPDLVAKVREMLTTVSEPMPTAHRPMGTMPPLSAMAFEPEMGSPVIVMPAIEKPARPQSDFDRALNRILSAEPASAERKPPVSERAFGAAAGGGLATIPFPSRLATLPALEVEPAKAVMVAEALPAAAPRVVIAPEATPEEVTDAELGALVIADDETIAEAVPEVNPEQVDAVAPKAVDEAETVETLQAEADAAESALASSTDLAALEPVEELKLEVVEEAEPVLAGETDAVEAHGYSQPETMPSTARLEETESAFVEEAAVAVEPETVIDPVVKAAPSIVGPYRIDSEIGRGRWGIVYRAYAMADMQKQIVALRLIDNPVPPSAIRRDERALTGLNHPNIASLLDTGTTPEGQTYFVSAMAEGMPLLDHVASYNLSLRQRLGLFKQICMAVDYAHRNLVIHRDLSPSSVRVARDGSVKVCDFGISRMVSESEAKPFSLDPAPTPRYASPEQVSYKQVGTGSDIYSLGAILFELLTSGQSPYQVANLSAHGYVEATRHQEPRKPSSVNPAIDSDLDTITLKALAKDPEKRYGAVAQLREDLEKYLTGTSPVQRPAVAAAAPAPAPAPIKEQPAPAIKPIEVSSTPTSSLLRQMWFPLVVLGGLALWGMYSAWSATTDRNEAIAQANAERDLRSTAESQAEEAKAATSKQEALRAEAEDRLQQAEQQTAAVAGNLRITQGNLVQTRAAAANLLFQLYDVVRNPVSTSAGKRKALDRAIAEIEQLAQQGKGDSQLNATLAAAYMRAGDLMNSSIRTGKDAPEDAQSFYRRGLQLNFDMAHQDGQPLLTAVNSHSGLAISYGRLGQRDQAFAAMRTAFNTFSGVTPGVKSGIEGRRTRATLFDASCQVTAMHGAVNEAMSICSDAAKYAEDLAKTDEPSTRIFRGSNYLSLAAQSQSGNDLARAMVLINAASITYANCLAQTPEQPECHSGVASVTSYLGAWQEKLTIRQSEESFKNAISALRTIAPSSPVRDSVDRVRASVHTRYAEYLRNAGRIREAELQAKESLALLNGGRR